MKTWLFAVALAVVAVGCKAGKAPNLGADPLAEEAARSDPPPPAPEPVAMPNPPPPPAPPPTPALLVDGQPSTL